MIVIDVLIFEVIHLIILICNFAYCLSTLPESTPPSPNMTPPPLSTTAVCDALIICSSLPEYTSLFSPTICDPLRIYPSFTESTPPPFQQLYCDSPRIYPSLSEYTPFSIKLYVRPTQNLPLPPRIYHLFQQLYATLAESTPPPPPEKTSFFNNYNIVRRSQNLPFLPEYTPFQQLYATLPESTPPSRNIPLPLVYNYAIFQEFTPQSLKCPLF